MTGADHPMEDEVSFAADIRPLFRDADVREMAFVLNLKRYEDVREYAELVYERLLDGTMPCDAPWPAAWTELFRRWTLTGHRP